MKTRSISATVVFLIASIGHAAPPAASSPITDDFVTYMQSTCNAADLGLSGDRFFPYVTPEGWRVGYRQTVSDVSWFKTGWPKADALKKFRDDLAATEAAARAWVAKKFPSQPFTKWPIDAQQIFLDLAFSQGVENLSPEFVAAVMKQDWQRLIFDHLHVRYQQGTPDNIRNFAFGQRWIYSGKLIPALKGGGAKTDEPDPD